MQQTKFETELSQALEKHSTEATVVIQNVIDNLPENATELNFEIFTAQDQDGFFTIAANLDGPDLYVLNKEIEDISSIFSPKHQGGKIVPYIPLVDDPFETEYEVNDIIVDHAAAWLKRLWCNVDSFSVKIAVVIVGHDDYGTTTPLTLK